ncbi:MAG: hypothetical protein GY915_01715 [bacterium]|nr:hypothetical protein [bacterium]
MALTLRRDKDAPLNIEEIDENFEGLDRRLQALEEHLERLVEGVLLQAQAGPNDE